MVLVLKWLVWLDPLTVLNDFYVKWQVGLDPCYVSAEHLWKINSRNYWDTAAHPPLEPSSTSTSSSSSRTEVDKKPVAENAISNFKGEWSAVGPLDLLWFSYENQRNS